MHLGVCLCGRGRIRQLSRGTGCCRARGGGRAKSWQAQHFGDAVAKSWQAQHFGDAVAEVVAGAAFCASGCSVIASIQGAHGTCVWTFGKNIACGVIRSFNLGAARVEFRVEFRLSLEGVSQMDSILPERLVALVRPGNDLVLRSAAN